MNCSKKIIGLGLLFAGALWAQPASAQTQVYFENFDTDTTTNWVVNTTGSGFNYADFFFDYSMAGIPPAPHQSGTTTRGLKLGANLGAGGVFPAGISVSPLGFGITANFDLRFDFWLNYNKSGLGSTELGGAGYGTAGTAAQVAGVADSIFISASTDGGTASSDYRIYSPDRAISYQVDDHVVLNDPTTPLAYAAGSRDNAAAYYVTNFNPGNLVFPASPVPPAQTNLFPRQTGTVAPAGSAGFRWHEGSLRKVGNTITYSIDGLLIATVDARTAAFTNQLGGSNILFNFYDINTGGSLDVDATNVLFALFDNVRITNFPNVVSVDTATAEAAETGPTPGVFTITRTSAGVPLTVNYTMTGTASNGVDYAALSGSVTFGATATTTNITVTPIDDAIAEATETVILNINASTQYVGAGSATVRIRDNEPAQLQISAISTQLYERTNDYATFQILRLGDTNAASFSVNVNFSGGATFNTDYTTNGIATIDPGTSTLNFRVLPIEDALVEGPETITATLVATPPYTVGASNAASVTLVDATLPPETVLFSDNFNIDSSTNWTRFFAALPDPTDDSFSQFGYNYGLGSDGIPPAPHSTNDTLGLRLTVNKNDPTAAAAALNFYPIGQSFSGNFALRFDMYLINGGGVSSTEYALFGINHSGTKTNWFRNSPGNITNGSFDGIFFDVEADGGGSGDYVMYTGPLGTNNPVVLLATNAAPFAGVFKSPPWTAAGVAANVFNSTNPIWADVEVSQLDGVVTLKINNTVILQTNNTTAYTTGNIMLGYVDAFDSIGPGGSAVIYDNVRVVRLAQPFRITKIQVVGGNVQIDFNSDLGAASSFRLQSASVVTGPYVDTAAIITPLGGNAFRATIPTNGSMQYYKIKF